MNGRGFDVSPCVPLQVGQCLRSSKTDRVNKLDFTDDVKPCLLVEIWQEREQPIVSTLVIQGNDEGKQFDNVGMGVQTKAFQYIQRFLVVLLTMKCLEAPPCEAVNRFTHASLGKQSYARFKFAGSE